MPPEPVPVSLRAPAPDGRPESIGPLLAGLRSRRGHSQLRLAEQLCAASGVPTVSRHEVSRWEREERVPGPFWLGWLAAVLDVPPGELTAAARRVRPGTPRRPNGNHPGSSGPAHRQRGPAVSVGG